MRYIELFAGIGGFRRGLEPLGWQCVWANEIDPYACQVYQQDFGNKELVEGDIRSIDTSTIPEFDMLVGGFPCQDISIAGKREGIREENRSGLFFEIIRVIRSRPPRWLLLENVTALLFRGGGMDIVLREFSTYGYHAQWDCIPASALGANHRRDRVWIIAYPSSSGFTEEFSELRKTESNARGIRPTISDTEDNGLEAARKARRRRIRPEDCGISRDVADTSSIRLQRLFKRGAATEAIIRSSSRWWASEPNVGRVAYGVPDWIDRIKCLGNAVVPQVVEYVGSMIKMDA